MQGDRFPPSARGPGAAPRLARPRPGHSRDHVERLGDPSLLSEGPHDTRPPQYSTENSVITFETARSSDVDRLVSINRDSETPWTESAFRDEFETKEGSVFVLRSPNLLLAFAVVRRVGAEMDILNLAVAPDHRRRGYGRLLARSLIEKAFAEGITRVFLEVREGNRAARGLYRSLGFCETQTRPDFYRNPTEDAILMAVEAGRKTG
jgi:ribosomal-protein-alanine N-acetyltransferase